MMTKFRPFAIALLMLSLLVSITSVNHVSATPAANGDAQQRVIVYFDPARKGNVMRALQSANGQVHYEFDALGAVAVTLPVTALQGIARNPNVTDVEIDVLRHPMGEEVPYGIDMVQARMVWDANLDGTIDPGAPTGEGITVCVIDSGIYAGHEDFAGLNLLGGTPTGWNNDTCGHGTHVAGTISAVHNHLGVVGVTPGEVSFYFVQVFTGAACDWTYSSTLANAANICAQNGADIISMSLGGAQKSKLEQRTFDNLYAQGTLSIAAAGNDGNTAYSYPASYSSVVSVAAIDEYMAIANFSQQNDQVEVAAPGVAVLSTVPWIATDELTVDGVTYTANHIEYAPTGTANGALVDGGLCTTTGSWSGKVVLCQRGDISFYDKVMNVQNSGGVAAVLYNNEPGNFLGTLGEGSTSNIIAISLSQEDGQYLVANKLGSAGSVFSELIQPGSGYEAWDGTSMATPHVSGVAALIWSADPTKTNEEIREALTATAFDLGTTGRDNAFGYGLVQAYDALQYLGGGGGGDDTTPPTIYDVTSTAPSRTGKFTISWKTDEPATGLLEVVGLGTYSSSELSTDHSFTVRGSKGVEYTYYITSVDAAGNSTTEGPFTHQN